MLTSSGDMFIAAVAAVVVVVAEVVDIDTATDRQTGRQTRTHRLHLSYICSNRPRCLRQAVSCSSL